MPKRFKMKAIKALLEVCDVDPNDLAKTNPGVRMYLEELELQKCVKKLDELGF